MLPLVHIEIPTLLEDLTDEDNLEEGDTKVILGLGPGEDGGIDVELVNTSYWTY